MFWIADKVEIWQFIQSSTRGTACMHQDDVCGNSIVHDKNWLNGSGQY
jgi:hypothetical protein